MKKKSKNVKSKAIKVSLPKKKRVYQRKKRKCKGKIKNRDKTLECPEIPDNKCCDKNNLASSSQIDIENKENTLNYSSEKLINNNSLTSASDKLKSYPLKDKNLYEADESNIPNDNPSALLNCETYLKTDSGCNVGNIPLTSNEGSKVIDVESGDDTLDFILEQELIKEQIKRNILMSSSDEYINSLVGGVNGSDSLEEQENMIVKAIRLNRKLANFCVTLEAALVKKLDKVTEEVHNLTSRNPKLVDEIDTIGRGFYSQFGAPYFKDSSGFYCPRNQDFNYKISKKQFVGYLYMQSDHTADIAALSNAIREYIIDDYVKKSHLDDLMKKLKEVNNKSQQDILKEDINIINNKVSFMKSVSLKYLVKDIADSDIDWMKISSKESVDILSPGECLRYWELVLSPKVNRGVWSQTEKKDLKKLAAELNYHNWDKIASLLNTKRTGYQCFILFKKIFGMLDFNRGRWSRDEDIQLSYLVSISEQGGVIGWAKVLYHLEDRTMAQALNRWYRLDPGLKKGKFTDEEDIILVNAVDQFGLDFQKVASVFPNRSAIQLRERYFAKRDMKINKCGEWSLAEDKLLMDLIVVHGEKKWSKIAQNFPSRNRIQIRHRYKCIKLNLQKDPTFKLENLNRFKRNTHVNAKNKRDEEAISKSAAINIISKTIEEGKIFYNKRRILKRTGRLKEREG